MRTYGRPMTPDDRIDLARQRYEAARDRLHALVKKACPGPHEPVQHRDMKPPWCRVCGRADDGQQIRPQEEAP